MGTTYLSSVKLTVVKTRRGGAGVSEIILFSSWMWWTLWCMCNNMYCVFYIFQCYNCGYNCGLHYLLSISILVRAIGSSFSSKYPVVTLVSLGPGWALVVLLAIRCPCHACLYMYVLWHFRVSCTQACHCAYKCIARHVGGYVLLVWVARSVSLYDTIWPAVLSSYCCQ